MGRGFNLVRGGSAPQKHGDGWTGDAGWNGWRESGDRSAGLRTGGPGGAGSERS